MFDFSLFAAAICTYTLWVVIRVDKKLDALGQLNALILTHLSKRYTAEEYPDEELEQAVNDWESWDSE
tara:strand:+ start:476 stop:679 length:204 start_codon:yes stop_codon:yes gene_type:complete